ncbi:hypothetical protein LRN_0895 [Ligilactobacillus ruminis DPC 6832]|uniref:non-specific serine/threonine protein kinase n=1 Tax=Ligilactobacillus ruminis DPC 6832 TaxID=1402208 RepID=A0A837DUB8_9LACO|nr:protein kinase [Ligilactobacillus ruminis]KIC04459.1 hypothetical protein LRN_0895 [Ligilactobacillus ruminis DPC 6832]
MNEKEKSVLAAVEKSIGNGWHFKNLMPLARGTFGNVYELAKNNPMIGPDYRAVKIVPTSKRRLNRVKEELKHLNRTRDNQNIVSYIDYGTVNVGETMAMWFVMEKHVPLPKYGADRAFSEKDVLRIGIDVSHALEACEREKIIHCDVKPSNIFVKSSKGSAYLLGDFSISLDDSQKKIVNEYSIGYSSPEQLKRIAEPLSNRSDIYSLGMTLYVLANNKKFPDQRDVLPEIEEISVELNAILRKACSYYPGNRYQSAAELRKELLKLMITKYC